LEVGRRRKVKKDYSAAGAQKGGFTVSSVELGVNEKIIKKRGRGGGKRKGTNRISIPYLWTTSCAARQHARR